MNILKKSKKFFKRLGPGIIAGAADDDPSGIGTYSQTGAQYGFNLLWTTIFIFPMLYAVQEISARIGVVTGKGLAYNIKTHYSKYLLYFIVLLLVIANTVNIGADFGAMAAATQLIVPLDYNILLILYACIITALIIFIPYKKYSAILKWLAISLVAYLITGLIVQKDWWEVLKGSFIPYIEFNFDYLLIIIGVLGTTISPYLMFWQTSEEVEEEISHRMLPKRDTTNMPKFTNSYLKRVRKDTLIGMFFSEITTWFIILTAASTLHTNGILEINTAAQAASALEPFAGSFSTTIFTLGIIGTGLLAIPVLAGSCAYAICEVFGFHEGLNKKFKQARIFYLVIIFSTFVGLLMNFFSINPIQALLYTAVFNGIISVPIIFILIHMGNNHKILGNYTNNFWINFFAVLAFIIMFIAAILVILSFFVG